MAERDFKTAAAKLLAQHPSAAEKTMPAPLENKPAPVAMPPADPPVRQAHGERRQNQIQSGREEKDAPASNRQAVVILGFIAATTAVMVLLVPNTTLGIGGNIALGVLGGGWFGYLINREFLQ